ncbi:MAG: ChbG/HpnK family deacetylase [Gemmatimonadaceae bacterium]
MDSLVFKKWTDNDPGLAMQAVRSLIVNADDFGLSRGVTDGILEAHTRGIVTSTSLMVRSPDARDAVVRGRGHPALSLGLHIDLGEWAYRDETWIPLYQVAPLDDELAVLDEVRRQLETFRSLVGSDPTHLDSHQHVHARDPVRSVVAQLAAELGVALRHVTSEVRYCGRFYGQMTDGSPLPGSLTVEALIGILSTLEPGTTELACHPGYANGLDTMYGDERAVEVAVLCHPRVRSALEAEGIALCSFAHVRPADSPDGGEGVPQ